MPSVLALDTATEACSLALSDGDTVRGQHELLPRAHNRHILGMLSNILEGQPLANRAEVIACGVGPGSFTGIRIAVSIAQGLGWAQNLPVHGFCSLSAQIYVARELGLLQEGDWVLSTIDAQIGQIYWLLGHWQEEQLRTVGAASICSPDLIEIPEGTGDFVVLGSGLNSAEFSKEDHTFNSGRHFPNITPDASVMARKLAAGELPLNCHPAHALSPQYVQRDIGWRKLSEQASGV